jgi:hypothetical protein
MSNVRPIRPSQSGTSLGAFRDLEPDICDLVRLCEMTDNLNHEWLENEESGPHAVLMSEILLERAQALKKKYYEACSAEE